MRRITLTSALLIGGFCGPLLAHAAAAQGVAPNAVIFGQSRNFTQNFSSMEGIRAAQGSGSTAERAARAARQAQFSRDFPGTPIRRSSISR